MYCDECGVCGGDNLACSDCDFPVCLNINNVNTSNGSGNMNINMTNQPACSYCEDSESNINWNPWPVQKEECEIEWLGNSTWIIDTDMSETECMAIPSINENGGWWFNGDVAGIQFFIGGVIITDLSGGTAVETFNLLNYNPNADCDADGIVDEGCNLIIGIDMTGQIIPPNEDELLLSIDFEDFNGIDICFVGTELEAYGNWSPQSTATTAPLASATVGGDQLP
jgi:hypothetical protein